MHRLKFLVLLVISFFFSANQAVIVNVDCLMNDKEQLILFLDDVHIENMRNWNSDLFSPPNLQKVKKFIHSKELKALIEENKQLCLKVQKLVTSFNFSNMYEHNYIQANLFVKLIPKDLKNDCLLITEDKFACFENLNPKIKKMFPKIFKLDNKVLELYKNIRKLKTINAKEYESLYFQFKKKLANINFSTLNTMHLICLENNINCKNVEFRIDFVDHIVKFHKIQAGFFGNISLKNAAADILECLNNFRVEYQNLMDEQDLKDLNNWQEQFEEILKQKNIKEDLEQIQKIIDQTKLKTLENKILNKKISIEILLSKQQLIVVHTGGDHNDKVKKYLLDSGKFRVINNLDFESVVPTELKELLTLPYLVIESINELMAQISNYLKSLRSKL